MHLFDLGKSLFFANSSNFFISFVRPNKTANPPNCIILDSCVLNHFTLAD